MPRSQQHTPPATPPDPELGLAPTSPRASAANSASSSSSRPTKPAVLPSPSLWSGRGPPSPTTSTQHARSRPHSPGGAAGSGEDDDGADEVTALIPPSASRQRSPPRTAKRKASISARSVRSTSGRSVLGGLFHYGATEQPSPVDQIPRVSPRGQVRVYTTPANNFMFYLTTLFTFLSAVMLALLLTNTMQELDTGGALPYRGSGFAECWLAFVGTWSGLGGMLFFANPSKLFFVTTLLTLLLYIPITLLALLSPALKRAHGTLILATLAVSGSAIVFALLTNFLVRRAKAHEAARIQRMLVETARGNEDSIARALVGLQGVTFGQRLYAGLLALLALIAGLAALVVVLLLTLDMCLAAFDAGVGLPSPHSRLITISPDFSPWPITVHLACVDPPNSTRSSPPDGSALRGDALPTIVYTSASGVPGSLALFHDPLRPARAGADAENPGAWLLDFQRANRDPVGRVCTWDRPGYGYSDVLHAADLGKVADVLHAVLSAAGEMDNKLLLVGEGYGDLVARVFAARHPDAVHSLLHLDAQTAQTYFLGSEPWARWWQHTTRRLVPSLLSPLGVARLPSALLRRSSSRARQLASAHPAPSSAHLAEHLLRARLQESLDAHAIDSPSSRALRDSSSHFPRNRPAIVLSSRRRVEADDNWADGQRVLANQVTTKGLVEWTLVDDVGHFVCERQGREVCERSLLRLLAL
ncbi:hypothetical protein Q5752_000757 [Cryptotrichosporon argae]